MRYCWLIIIACVLFLTSCNKRGTHSKEHPLAKVHDEYLYSTDLEGVVPAGSSAKDSVEMVKNYVQSWVRQRLVVHQAEENLPKDQKDFEKELQEYKNSLIVYKYESKLVEQKLDTVVSEKEIVEYYNANNSNFELKDNIVKVLYVKMKLKDPSISKIRSLLKSGKPADKNILAQTFTATAVNSFLDENSWLFFNDLLKEIPIKTYDQEEYLQNHRFVEFSDENFTYLLNILDFKIKEGLSPLSLEKDNVKNIVINKRKIKLVNDMEKDVYDQAVKSKEFEIY